MEYVEVAKRRKKVKKLVKDGVKDIEISRILQEKYSTIRSDISTCKLQNVSLDVRKAKARQMRQQRISCSKIAKEIGVTRASVYNYLKD